MPAASSPSLAGPIRSLTTWERTGQSRPANRRPTRTSKAAAIRPATQPSSIAVRSNGQLNGNRIQQLSCHSPGRSSRSTSEVAWPDTDVAAADPGCWSASAATGGSLGAVGPVCAAASVGHQSNQYAAMADSDRIQAVLYPFLIPGIIMIARNLASGSHADFAARGKTETRPIGCPPKRRHGCRSGPGWMLPVSLFKTAR